MRRLFSVSAALLCTLLPLQASAQATRACLTAKETQALVSFALPDVISAVTTKCALAAGKDSYLGTSGTALSERYRPAANAAWPTARPAIRKLAVPDGQLLDAMPDESLKGFAGALAATAIVRGIKPQQCSDIDRGMRLLSPLPPENLSMLVGFMLEILSRPTAQAALAKAKPPFNLCPIPAGAGQPVATK